ncbi:MAG: 6-bladed beta-propeller [Rhodothermus sp.]|nr:6-bladed beta-propeller [Rhodothermus sp.]
MISLMIVLLLGLIASAVQAQQQRLRVTFRLERPILLKEPPEAYMQTVTSVTRLDSLLWITGGQPGSTVLYVYDLNGQFIQQVGEQGDGPHAYRSAGFLRIFQDTLWLWDNMGLRLLGIDPQTRQVVQRYVDFSLNCQDFIYRYPFVIFSHSQRTSQFITIFDLRYKRYVASFGEGQYEDVILSLMAGTGHLAYEDSLVYFARPSQAALYRLHLRTRQIQRFPLEVPGFTAASYEGPRVPALTPQAVRYIFTHSVNRGVWRTRTGLVLLVDTGAFQFKGFSPVSNGNRSLNFVIVDFRTLQQIGHIHFETDFIVKNGLNQFVGWDPETTTFYFYSVREEEPLHQLTPVRFYLEPEAH